MSRRFNFLIFAFLFCLRQIGAQSPADTALALPSVEVLGEKMRGHLASGERSEQWDSLALSSFLHGNLGEMLEQQSGVFVKNSGPGSLSTLSTRGGSAGHTAVVWNGLPIQSPMLGLLDLSLLSAQLADGVHLRLGGNSSLWGSGAIGGVLALENRPVFFSPLLIQVGSNFGSFGRFDQSAKVEWGNQKWGTSTTLSHQKTDNDFPFKLSNGDEKRLTNAHREQFDFLQEFYLKINARQQLALHAWWQMAERGIPPTVTQTRNEATQKDEAKRLALHWNRVGNRSVWNARLGFFAEEIDYRDPLILLEAISHFWSLTGDVDGQVQWGENGQIVMGFTQILTGAFADEYAAPPTESRSSVFFSFKKFYGKTNAQAIVRQSLVDGEMVGFAPSFSASHLFSKHFSIRAKVSRNYRLPTLNDRFWRPGGNENLRPEKGWSQEIGTVKNFSFGGDQLKYELTLFNRKIKDWIMWSPTDGVSFWSAKNLTEVWSRGIEQRLHFSHKTGQLKWKFSAGYDLVRSTNQVALETPKIVAGEQLIYVPVHQASGEAAVFLGTWSVNYRHRLVSRFHGPNDNLDGHHLGYFQAEKGMGNKVVSGIIFFKIENVWSENYRVVERRPMPGRSFQVGMNLKFRSS